MFMTGTILMNLLSLLFTPFMKKPTARYFLRRAFTAMFDLYMRIMEASGALINNRDVLKRVEAAKGGLLIIANHPSMFDAPILFSRIRGLVCVFKSSLNRSLGIARTARLIGHLSNDGGIDMIRELSITLKRGEKVLLFPEGTRTTTDVVDSFNPGYALAAIRAQVPVQLLRIHSDTPILSKKQSFLRATRFPCKFRLDMGPVIEPGDFKTVKAFNEFVESWYRNNLRPDEPVPVRHLPVIKDCSESSDTYTCTFAVPGDPFYCRDHMPGNPIVPAYAQMAWARELMNELQPESGDHIEYFRWKFLDPILPGDRITIDIDRSSARNKVVISRDGQRVTQGLLSLQGENA